MEIAKELVAAGDLEDAARELEVAHELDPSNAGLEAYRGWVLVLTGRVRDGVEICRGVATPPEAGILVEGERCLAWGALFEERWDDARRHSQLVLNASPSQETERRILSALAAPGGRVRSAEHFFSFRPPPGWGSRPEVSESIERRLQAAISNANEVQVVATYESPSKPRTIAFVAALRLPSRLTDTEASYSKGGRPPRRSRIHA